MTMLKKKLLNPFALVLEGFAAGALLFFATMSPEPEALQSADSAPVAAVVIA
jgi:hypothetical protein